MSAVTSTLDWQQSKLIYPGDWMRFHDAADFKAFWNGELPLPGVCSGLSNSALASELLLVHDNLDCGRPLAVNLIGIITGRAILPVAMTASRLNGYATATTLTSSGSRPAGIILTPERNGLLRGHGTLCKKASDGLLSN